MESAKKRIYHFLLYNFRVLIVLLIAWAAFIFICGGIEDKLYDNHLHHLACWKLPAAQEALAGKKPIPM